MATSNVSISATATPAVTLSNPISVDELQLLGAPTINIPGDATVDGLLGLEEGFYVIVEPSTSATDNGLALEAAYATAKALTGLSETQRATVLVPPGKYELSVTLEMDTQYVDICGITGNPKSVYIDGQIQQTVPNCNLSGLWIKTLSSAGTADSTCIVDNCQLGDSSTEGFIDGQDMPQVFRNCSLFIGASLDFSGVVEFSRIKSGGLVKMGDDAVIRHCVVIGQIREAQSATTETASIYQCSLSEEIHFTLTNNIATPYNVVDADITI